MKYEDTRIPVHLRPDPPMTLPPLPKHLKDNSAYIPTPFIVPPELNVGEHWYIKFPNAISLSEVLIEEVTPKTVLLKPIEKNQPMRYKKSDIEFVEKVEKSL